MEELLEIPAWKIQPGDALLNVDYDAIGTVTKVTPDYGLTNSVRLEFADRVVALELAPNDDVAIIRDVEAVPHDPTTCEPCTNWHPPAF